MFLFLRAACCSCLWKNSAWTLSFLKKQALKLEGNRAKVPLTCFLCHSLEPNDNPQKYPRKAHLDDEQLLSLSSPGFAPPPVQHHSSSSDCLRHRFNHHTGHGALLSRAFRRYPRWWCKGTRTWGEEAEAHKLTVRVLKLLDGRRHDWLLDGFVKFTRLWRKYTSGFKLQNKTYVSILVR